MQKAGEPENDAGPNHIEGLAPAYFALIINPRRACARVTVLVIIVAHVVKHQSLLINTYRWQESLKMMQCSPSIIAS